MRRAVNRYKSSKQFKSRHGKTHRVNLLTPKRGGFRL